MLKVTIIYSGWRSGRKIEFKADEVFYKTEYSFRMIGYLPKGKNRRKWFPIDGKIDDMNDYTGTIVNIEELNDHD